MRRQVFRQVPACVEARGPMVKSYTQPRAHAPQYSAKELCIVEQRGQEGGGMQGRSCTPLEQALSVARA